MAKRTGAVSRNLLIAVALALCVAGPGAAAGQPRLGPAHSAAKPSALWVGDSYTMGAGATNPRIYAEAKLVSRALGWHLELDAAGGTGFVAASGYGPPIPARLPNDKARYAPAFVVIDGGRNDHASTSAETQAVTAYFDAVARDFPEAHVIVITPFLMRSQPSDYSATRSILEAQARSHSWQCIDPLSAGWINSESAALVAADGVHPDDAGYAYLAGHLAPLFVEAIARYHGAFAEH